jgi:hypothetical protein
MCAVVFNVERLQYKGIHAKYNPEEHGLLSDSATDGIMCKNKCLVSTESGMSYLCRQGNSVSQFLKRISVSLF